MAHRRKDARAGLAARAGGAKKKRAVVVYAAVSANVVIAVAKFIVAAMSGSSAILSEGIHSTVDTLNECLLLLGLRRSRLPADDAHPFGHGKELYFWSLMVAVMLFGVGGGMTIYEGIVHLVAPRPADDVIWMYVVLGVAATFEGVSFTFAYRALGAQEDAGNPLRWLRRIRRSKDPSVFTVFLEDFAALVGIAIALIGVTLGAVLDNPYFDGIASLLIGLTLTTVAVVLAHETRNLLVGESAPPETVASIRALIQSDPAVSASGQPLTMQLGPDEILVVVDVQLRAELPSERQAQVLAELERVIRDKHPKVRRIALQPRATITPSA